jgi:hypothetical protein
MNYEAPEKFSRTENAKTIELEILQSVASSKMNCKISSHCMNLNDTKLR